MKVDRHKVWLMFDKKCAYCGCELKTSSGKHMHIDHVEAVVRDSFAKNVMFRGWNHNEENLFPSCPRCNNYKSTMSIETFRNEIKQAIARLEKVVSYRNAIRYGMIEVKQWDGVFWFERLQGQASSTQKEQSIIANVV